MKTESASALADRRLKSSTKRAKKKRGGDGRPS